MIDSFRFTPTSREIFEEYKAKFKAGEYKDDLERAHIFYYLNRACFGGDMKPPTFGTSKTTPSTFRPDKLDAELSSTFERIQKVTFEHRSFESLIPLYDSPDTLFYIDPPYRCGHQYVVGKFTDDKYGLLRDCCEHIKGRFIITINDDQFIRDTFKDFQFIDNEVVYTAGRDTVSRRAFKELIITNYDPKEVI